MQALLAKQLSIAEPGTRKDPMVSSQCCGREPPSSHPRSVKSRPEQASLRLKRAVHARLMARRRVAGVVEGEAAHRSITTQYNFAIHAIARPGK